MTNKIPIKYFRKLEYWLQRFLFIIKNKYANSHLLSPKLQPVPWPEQVAIFETLRTQ